MTAQNSRSGKKTDLSLTGFQQPKVSDLDNFVRRLREPVKQLGNRISDPQGPLVEPNKITDAWACGDSNFHINVGIRPHLPGGDVCQLCIDLQWVRTPPPNEARYYAIPLVRDFYFQTCGVSPNWLNRPVLVASVDARKDHKRVPEPGSSAIAVRLNPTHLCAVCSRDAGQLEATLRRCRDANLGVEYISVLTDRKVDGFFLPVVQDAGRRASSIDKCPSKMVKRGTVVIGGIPENESPANRNGINALCNNAEPVTLRVILRSGNPERIGVSLHTPSLDLSLQRLRVSHPSRPLEPSAVEHTIMHKSEPIRATPQAPRRVPYSTPSSGKKAS
jgi:hypothetical protein